MPMRPCWVEIRTRSLEDNYRFLQSLASPHAEVLAMIKADAYGHSLALCAPAVARAGAQWLGVTSVEEGVAARALCLHARIVLASGLFPGQGTDVISHSLTPVLWDPWQLDELEQAARAVAALPRSVPVHLEIDTGMSRQGVSPENLAGILPRFHAQSPLKLEGVMTHLFAADEADGTATDEQFAQLDTALEGIQAAAQHPEWLSVGQSAALLAGRTGQIANLASRFGMKPMLRPGLSLFGVAPEFDPDFEDAPPPLTAAHHRLQPVLTWKTAVASVRSVAPGAVIGYNGTFVATEPMRLALIPVGYADGLHRSLGNRFSLLVRGERAPLVGRVSMDQSVLDVTEIPDVQPGDEVVILGAQGEETITAFHHAKATGTIPWEVFTRIVPRVPRIPV
jgi:alanine racemase